MAKKNLFSNYLTYNCANNDYTDITYRFVKAIDFIDPADRIRDLVCDPRTLDLGLGTQDPRVRDLELQDQGPYQQNKGVIDFTKSPNYLVKKLAGIILNGQVLLLVASSASEN